ncbi:hypothetical protein HPB48_010502 [Haemaphysalis longicornis]|uniref:Gustatory receptor n=1 Tax=Haemaphysalis longicornis TaxID=44386 RepID=A0A9J6FM48_HAELO|nr:hypothetical protein HPB48_010502 [Haemaphysalis longicornis]
MSETKGRTVVPSDVARRIFTPNLYMRVLESGPTGFLQKIAFLKWPLLLAAYAYTLHTTLNVCLTFMRVHNMMKILDIVSYVMRSFFAAVNLHLAFGISTPSKRLLCLSVDFVLNEDIADYCANFLYGINITTTNVTLDGIEAAAFFNLTAFDLLSIVPGLLIADYVAACLKIKSLVRGFRTVVSNSNKKGNTQAEDVKRYQEMSYEAWKEIKRLDTIYSTAVFLWYLDIIINLVLSVRNLAKGVRTGQCALDSTYYAVIFLILSLSASSVDVEAKELVQEAKQLRTTVNGDDWQTSGQMLLLETGLQSSRLVLSSGHFCVLDRPFILGVVGAIVTYTILLVQLTPAGT